MARSAIRIALFVTVVLAFASRSSRATALEAMTDDSVFLIRATCKDEPVGRSGTAFLVKDWPSPGETSLVTALHVIYSCNSLEVYTSACAAEPSKRIVEFGRQNASQITAWPEHDLAVLRHVTFASNAAAGTIADDVTLPAGGQNVQVLGQTKNNPCAAGAATVTSTPLLSQLVKDAGSVPLTTKVLAYYGTPGPGASGGPVVRLSDHKVIAVHEAGFRNSNLITAAIPIGGLTSDFGPSFEVVSLNWAGVEFTIPLAVHAREDQGLTEEQISMKRWSLSLGADVTTLSATPFYRLMVGLGLELDLSTNATFTWSEGIRFDLLRLGYWFRRSQFTDPAGQSLPLESSGLLLGGEVGAYYFMRFRRLSKISLEPFLGLRGSAFIDSPPQGSIKPRGYWGPNVGLRVGLGRVNLLEQSEALVLDIQGGAEVGKPSQYQFTGAGAELTQDDADVGFAGGFALGLEW